MKEWSKTGWIIQPSSSFSANVFAIVVFPSWGVRRFLKYFRNPRLQDINRKFSLNWHESTFMHDKILKTEKNPNHINDISGKI